MTDDAAQLRRRQDDARKALEALSSDEGRASAAFTGQVFDGGAIPNSVPRMFLTHPFGASATEAAGAAPTVTVGPETVPVLVLGPGVPAAGDRLVARQVGGTWVSPMMGGYPPHPTHPYPGCPCAQVPDVIAMVVSPEGCDSRPFHSSTIRYQAIPTGLAPLAIEVPNGSGKAWLSDETFVDENGDSFRYHLICNFGSFTLTRVYETSVFGTPFEDAIRYTWNISGTGNTCTPFAMTSGTIYAGGSPTCDVDLFEAP